MDFFTSDVEDNLHDYLIQEGKKLKKSQTDSEEKKEQEEL